MTRLVEDPVLRQRYTFTREGDVLTVELWVDPGGGVTPHVHPAMEERFKVLEGEVEFLAGRRWEQRDEIVVPKGTRHAFRNRGGVTAHMVTEVEPAMELEAFLTDVAELSHRKRFTRRGIPTSPRAAVELAQLAMRYSGTVELETPMRPLIPLLARLGSSRTAGHSTAMR
jgi:mannose-6-phosphate isomerase-like protein (cupin superfamily)